MWIPKSVVQTMRSLDHETLNATTHSNASKIIKLFDPNEVKFKGHVYRWVSRPKMRSYQICRYAWGPQWETNGI